MGKAPLVLSAAILLAGCVSEQNALRAQAKANFQTAKELCNSQNFKTHLEKAKCQDDAYRRTEYVYNSDKDLLDQLIAQRETLSAKIDRGEITQEEANFQLAQFKSGLVEQENQRGQERQANAIAVLSLTQQMTQPPQPLPTYQAPTPPNYQSTTINCTSTPIGSTVFTNCN
jgi:hypothetical protein